MSWSIGILILFLLAAGIAWPFAIAKVTFWGLLIGSVVYVIISLFRKNWSGIAYGIIIFICSYVLRGLFLMAASWVP